MSSVNVGEIPEGLELLHPAPRAPGAHCWGLLVLTGFQTGLSGVFIPGSTCGYPQAVSAGQRRNWLGLNLGFLGVFPLEGEGWEFRVIPM